MNRRQRAITAIAGNKPDRIPTCFWHHFSNLKGQDMVDAHVRFFRESRVDILKMMCDEFFFYPIPHIQRTGEWLNLRPLGPKDAWIQGHVERASQIIEALHGEAFTLYNLFAPLSNLKHAYGDERIMADLREDESAVLHAMDVIAEDNCTLAERLIREAGADGIFMIVQSGESSRFSIEEYRRIVRPSELQFIQRADELSDYNILHMCGWSGIPNRLELWMDYPAPVVNLAVYNEHITLGEGKKLFPDQVVMGGFDRCEEGVLRRGSIDQIRTETRRLVHEAGRDRLIISADCSLPADIPYENLRAVVEELEALAE